MDYVIALIMVGMWGAILWVLIRKTDDDCDVILGALVRIEQKVDNALKPKDVGAFNWFDDPYFKPKPTPRKDEKTPLDKHLALVESAYSKPANQRTAEELLAVELSEASPSYRALFGAPRKRKKAVKR